VKRLFGFILRLAVLVAVAVWLADRPGTARIIWHDYVIETSAAFLGLCALGIGFVFYLLFRFWHLLIHGPELWRMSRKLKKMRQGQDCLTQGLAAVAGGDAAEAGRFAVGARKLLGPTVATRLLQAQAAQLAGDHNAAREIFRALAEETDSATLGYRGLIMDARRTGNWDEVDRLIGKLQQLKPKTPWLHLIRFESAARRQQWNEAGAALEHASSARFLEPERLRRYRAAIMIATSQTEARQGRHAKALQAAEQAASQAPDWLPAVINLAQSQTASGHSRAARRTVEKNWARMAHPQLASIYRVDGSDPIEVYKLIEQLCRDSIDAPVSRLVLADAALKADIWGEARRHLLALLGGARTTQSAYRMMARLERRESGDEQAAMQWMTKAAEAPPDPAWLCRACGGAHEDWQAACRHCGTFATLEWQSPGVSRMQKQDAGNMLGNQGSDIGILLSY
jgi:HemY protein